MNNIEAAGGEPAPSRLTAAVFFRAGLLLCGAAPLLVPSAHRTPVFLGLEVAVDALIVLFVSLGKPARGPALTAAAAALLAADTLYALHYLWPGYPKFLFQVQVAAYMVYSLSAAYYLVRAYYESGIQKRTETWGFLALFLCFMALQIKYVAIPVQTGIYASPLIYALIIVHRIAESAVLAMAVLLGTRARSAYWFYTLNGLTLLPLSSFAIGYNSTTANGVPFQEYGWFLGLLFLLAAQTFPLRAGPAFARWNSIRVRLVWFISSIATALLLLLYLLRAFVAQDFFFLTSSFFLLMFGVWFVANLIGFRVSEDIHALLDGVEAAGPRPAAQGIRLPIYEAELFAEKLRAAYDTIREQSGQAALAKLSAQVAHDIRSPLAALESALKDVSQLPENKRLLIRGAAGRIRDIANELLEKNRRAVAAGEQPLEPRLLAGLIESVVTEKHAQYRDRLNVNIDFGPGPESYGLFAKVRPAEFGRLLSNLINNAVEALDGGGSVQLSLGLEEGKIALKISDSGKGIPPEVLSRLGRRGETHGKAGGTGLGLHHAKTAMEGWGGSLAIASEQGKGTTVMLILPRAEPPRWFVPGLVFGADARVVILDDDAGIHRIWQGLFESARLKERGIKICSFSAPDDLRRWVGASPAEARNAVYLLDYELRGHRETGLDLAGELKLGGKAILVTSRCDEEAVLRGCEKLGLRLIPKSLAGLVPVSVLEKAAAGPAPRRAVLLDDDALVRLNWKTAARTAGVELTVYKAAAELLEAAGALPVETPLYIDSDLGEGAAGEEIARALHEKGFSDITLATGHAPDRFGQFRWLKVAGKEPPWERKG